MKENPEWNLYTGLNVKIGAKRKIALGRWSA